jgi:hypothetical protein
MPRKIVNLIQSPLILAEIFIFTHPPTPSNSSFFNCFLNGIDDMREPQVIAYEKNNSTWSQPKPNPQVPCTSGLCALTHNSPKNGRERTVNLDGNEWWARPLLLTA